MMNQYYLDNNLRLNELDVSSFKVIFPNKNYIKKVRLIVKKVRLRVEMLLVMKIIS